MKLLKCDLILEKNEKPNEFLYRFLRPISKTTYFENGELQCLSGKTRSIDDLFALTKTYFPDITIEEFIIELNKIPKIETKGGDKYILGMKICPDIKKFIFHYFCKGLSYFINNTWHINNTFVCTHRYGIYGYNPKKFLYKIK
jgi:hypothetical protein